jgi:beta-phosphoglucomutase
MVAKFAVLWDMDGVLVDTGELHYQSYVGVFEELGVAFDRQAFQRVFGMTASASIRSLAKDIAPERVTELDQRKEALFRQMLPGQVQALQGVEKWLRRLKAEGVAMAVASSAPQENIDAVLDELALRPYFDAIISASRLPSKPDPAVFLEAARQLGFDPSQCIVIEDAIAGVTAARRAGMKCIAVTTTNPAEKLAQADLVVDRLDGLPEDFFNTFFE